MTGSSRVPAGLKAAGRALWRAVVDEFELDAWESSLLLAACRCADQLDRLAVEAADSPVVVANHKGDLTANPALTEARQQGLCLSRLLASLRLPSGDEMAGRPQRRGASRGSYGVRAVS